MQPNLMPFQSRLLASVIAIFILVIVGIDFQPRYLVYATQVHAAAEDDLHSQFGQAIPLEDSPIQLRERDQEQVRGEDTLGEGEVGYLPILGTEPVEDETQLDVGYSPDFTYFDRSLIGRVPQGIFNLTNNVKQEEDSDPGVTRNFVLENSQSKSRRAEEATTSFAALDERAAKNVSRRVWISANTCRQPLPTTEFITEADSPQLILYISNSTENQKPGPNATNDLAIPPIKFRGGYANFSMQTNADIFIGISAPLLTEGWTGSWHYEVAASVDGYYHSYHDDETFLFMVDTDSESALFITPNITATNDTAEIEKWTEMDPLPFIMYAQPNNKWGAMTGLERSFCALQVSTVNMTIDKRITTKFGEWSVNQAKSQFHIQGLQRATAYQGFIAFNGTTEGLNLTGTGISTQNGGQVWKQFNWTTKASTSCQVIFDLPFCSAVAHAVPSSLEFQSNTTALIEKYDTLAANYYKNFTNSLDQVACDTTGTAQYSLARTCEHCRVDYKTWLCSVLMPRCEDFGAPAPWLQPRNIGTPFPNGSLAYASNTTADFNRTVRDRFAFSQSRNPMINDEIKPGPYKELLPCEDLCFDIVRSCPAQLGFSCPNEPARHLTYGRKDDQTLTCNFPGAVVDLNVQRAGATRGIVGNMLVLVVAVVVGGLLWI